MDNTIVMAMFEELNNNLQTLSTKIEQNATKEKQIVEVPSDVSIDDTSDNNLLKKLHELSKSDHSDIMNMIGSVHNQVYESQHIVTNNVAQIKTIVAQNTHQFQHHSIEIHSSKVVISFVVLFLTIVVLLTTNIIQLNENGRLQNNDKKYRYFKAFGTKIDKAEIRFLEGVFNDEADQERQQMYLTKLINFENDFAQRAADITLAKQKEKKAKQLMIEAEKIRRKK
jgi:hypothetical protein